MAVEYPCFNCKHKKNEPGDAHIRCSNPLVQIVLEPQVLQKKASELNITRTEVVQQMIEKIKPDKAVFRVVWSGSGFYPLIYDGGTVIGCSNFEEVHK